MKACHEATAEDQHIADQVCTIFFLYFIVIPHICLTMQVRAAAEAKAGHAFKQYVVTKVSTQVCSIFISYSLSDLIHLFIFTKFNAFSQS